MIFFADSKIMNFLPEYFEEFVAPNCDRFLFLQEYFNNHNIPFSVISLDECKHIYIQLPQQIYNPTFKMKTVIAHYDRAVGSNNEYITPGANDNSAAVFQILLWVKRLLNANNMHTGKPFNVRVFLTDGEELGSAQSQGSFALASLFKKMRLENDDVYVLDGCGRGDTLAVSNAGRSSKAPLSFTKKFDMLFEKTCKLARESSPGKWITIPVPYSDNAGFIANGIPAVALTVLPSDEASLYMRNLQKDKNLSSSVMSKGVSAHGAGFLTLDARTSSQSLAALRAANIDPAEALLMSEKLPKTWRMMHTEHDNAVSLSEQAFIIMAKFLDNLAESKTMA